MNFIKRNAFLFGATVTVAAVFISIPLFATRNQATWPPSLGDLGNYIGGAMALIVFLWLIAGHLENQWIVQPLFVNCRDGLWGFHGEVAFSAGPVLVNFNQYGGGQSQ